MHLGLQTVRPGINPVVLNPDARKTTKRPAAHRPVTVDRLRIRAGIIDFTGVAAVAFVLSDELITGPANQSHVYEGLGILIAMNVLYHGAMELVFGRSFGKRWTGLMVMSVSGARPSRSQLIIRNLARVIDILPNLYLVAIIVTRAYPGRSQRVGDLLAGTTVQPQPGDSKSTPLSGE